MLNYKCFGCKQRIRPANFVTGSGVDEALECDCCEAEACHIRCFNARYQAAKIELKLEEEEWLCDDCITDIEEEGPCICQSCAYTLV